MRMSLAGTSFIMSNPDSPTFSVSLSPDNSYVHYRSLASARTAQEMGLRLRTAVELGNAHQVASIMFDVRGVIFRTGIAAQYEYAYNQAWQMGLKRSWRIALLVSPGDRSYDFMETAFINSGYQAQLFTDETRAATWLSRTPPPQAPDQLAY